MVKKPTTETDVENYRHDKAKRINIPTAENQSLVPDDEKALKVLRYPRNPDLDPQLVWRGRTRRTACRWKSRRRRSTSRRRFIRAR